MPEKTYRIGELANEFSLPVETIRYYEREGLLAAPTRSAGNYRLYDERQRERLSFIRRCRSLDMTLDEVRALLLVKDTPEEHCSKVNALLDTHIHHVTERIGELRRLKQQLQHLREQCGADRLGRDCAILKNLSAAGPVLSKSTRGARRTRRTKGWLRAFAESSQQLTDQGLDACPRLLLCSHYRCSLLSHSAGTNPHPSPTSTFIR